MYELNVSFYTRSDLFFPIIDVIHRSSSKHGKHTNLPHKVKLFLSFFLVQKFHLVSTIFKKENLRLWKPIHSFSKNKRTSKCLFPKYTSNSFQVLPLALQITTIAGNIMVSERMVTFSKKVIIHYGVVFSLSFFPFCFEKDLARAYCARVYCARGMVSLAIVYDITELRILFSRSVSFC